MAWRTLTPEDSTQVAQEHAKERERHVGDAFERHHKLVVEMGSIITHRRGPAR
ncbi:MAG: hypothetical protein MUE90_10460 [Thermoanaerobaculales bacterium]|jgi:hypothetical protein|nr:hypothetical protein [Thermoanaerobaculales bacterium]